MSETWVKIEKGLIISVILSIIVYAVFIFLSDYNSILNAVKMIGLFVILLLLCLSMFNYCFRFIRWHYLLSKFCVKIPIRDSLKVFLAGLCLTITPGKAGELFKASFVKEFADVSRIKVIPIIILERVFDLIGFAMILLLSLLFFSPSQFLMPAVIAVGVVFISFICVFLFLRLNSAKKLLLLVIERFKFLHDKKNLLLDTFNDYAHMSILRIIFLIMISFAGWLFETLELYVLLLSFGVSVTVFSAGFVYGLSSLVGLLTFTPGGILGFEASSELLMSNILGVAVPVAAVITLIVRLTTLWFAVLIGLVSYVKFFKH
ncbi:Lysylphosphatidylglycerol synthase TM region [Candidatus Tiddalikarchaeum anstoanum]|nr:Lysylphosphatidylglycerol synthase TM region [Candidatus Tiddalikarchaeum anstoanum]